MMDAKVGPGAKKIPPVAFYQRGKGIHTRPDGVEVQAQQIWLICTAWVMFSPEAVSASGTIKSCEKHGEELAGNTLLPFLTYGDLAKKMGYSAPQAGINLGTPLGIVGHLCVEAGLPALNSIVCNSLTKAPGADVVLTPGSSVVGEQIEVLSFDWHSIRVPSIATLRIARSHQLGRV